MTNEVISVGVGKMLDVEEIATEYGADLLSSPTSEEAFRDQRIFWVCPTRGKIDVRVKAAWDDLLWPYNATRKRSFARGYEVGHAYDALMRRFLASEQADFPYVLTIEDDNLPPRNGLIRLLETMEAGPPDGGKWAAVSGLYHTKDPMRVPLALGDVDEFRKTGKKDFRAIDLSKVPAGQRVVETLGIPMGFALWRTGLFRDVPAPWCRTVSDAVKIDGEYLPVEEFERRWKAGKIDRTRTYTRTALTQDTHLCNRAVDRGHRFCVDLSVDVGHLDTKTGMVY